MILACTYVLLSNTANKAFKADSQRVAFSVQIEFCVYGATD